MCTIAHVYLCISVCFCQWLFFSLIRSLFFYFFSDFITFFCNKQLHCSFKIDGNDKTKCVLIHGYVPQELEEELR